MEEKKPKDLEKEILELEKNKEDSLKKPPSFNTKPENNLPEEEKPPAPQEKPEEEKTISSQSFKESNSKNIGLMKEKKDEKEEEPSFEDKKMTLLKREDIITMKKDIKKIREAKASQEGKNVSSLELGFMRGKKEKNKQEFNKDINQKPLAADFNKKPKSSKKLFIRILFILIFVLIGGGGYWFFKTQKDLYQPPVVENGEKDNDGKDEIEINIPESFATINKEYRFQLGEKDKIVPATQNFEIQNFSEEGLTRIILKDHEEKLVALNEIEKIFGLEISNNILSGLNQKNINLLGSIQENKIKKSLVIELSQNLSFPLLEWEEEIEDELLKDIEEPEVTPIFQDFSFENRTIRCLKTSSDYSLSFCYTTINDYLILSDSFSSMEKTIIGLNDATRRKIGQLFIVGFEGTSLTPELREFFEKYYPGGILLNPSNVLSTHQVSSLIKDLKELSLELTGQPLIVAINQEGGTVNTVDFFEELTAQSDLETDTVAYQAGLKRGGEMANIGVDLIFSPLLDTTKKGDYIYNRSFQENAATIGELGKSLVLGYQEAGIYSCLKYFPGYGGILANPAQNLMMISDSPEISQFEEVMSVEPKFVMAASAIYESIDPTLPFIFSEEGVKYLEHNLGRDPLIITDDLSQQALLNAYDIIDIVTNPIKAGVDLELISGYQFSVEDGLDAFIKAINNNQVSESEVEEARSRIIKFKENL
jgi:beta-N-acetylhexosaminidase